MRMKVKSRTAGREKYEKPRLHVYQGQAQNWGIIAITTLCRFLFLTRFWDDKAKALLVYGLTDEKLHGKLAFGAGRVEDARHSAKGRPASG